MQVYFFPAHNSWNRLGASARELQGVLERLAAETDTGELVVALHLVRRSSWSGGTAYVRQWVRPSSFYARRGKWRLSGSWQVPENLPERFKLIRLLLPDSAGYPLTELDRYGWQHRFGRFEDHLAFFFAHELHHFRRFHLDLHGREGEHSANAWAEAHCRSLGFAVESVRLRPRKGRTKKKGRSGPTFWQVLNPVDFLPVAQACLLWRGGGTLLGAAMRLVCRDRNAYIADKMRHIQLLGQVQPGRQLWITFDPSRRYLHESARLVRLLRRPSLRAVIETGDGKIWRWPMAWLSIEPPKH